MFKLSITSAARKVVAALALGALMGTLSLSLAAKPAQIPYTEKQQETIAELIETLENRHYAKLHYDDELSSAHLDGYIDKLDGGKMFFLASDLKEFERFRENQDDALRKGDLEPGYVIFLRFHERLEARLKEVIAGLPS